MAVDIGTVPPDWGLYYHGMASTRWLLVFGVMRADPARKEPLPPLFTKKQGPSP